MDAEIIEEQPVGRVGIAGAERAQKRILTTPERQSPPARELFTAAGGRLSAPDQNSVELAPATGSGTADQNGAWRGGLEQGAQGAMAEQARMGQTQAACRRKG